MKFSESWLREWVNPAINRNTLSEKLTMAGLEVEALTPVATKFTGVVVGQVISTTPHPDADRLKICEVDVGTASPVTIVCGASNVKANVKVPVALTQASLGNHLTISVSQIRGVTSQGMLCSAKELGLAEESEGLLIFPEDAPLGKDVWEYLSLSDHIIEIGFTPNRGDCLSILGLAKEIAALTESPLIEKAITAIPANIQDVLPIKIQAPKACPRYAGRVIRSVNASAETPLCLKEKLRRSGLRSIHIIVDIMNYVMLELGQPMHAFDLLKIEDEIVVRVSNAGEKITLLDNSEITLDHETLVIADKRKALAIAGIMGGLDSGVNLDTKDIFLESAFFKSECIARTARHFQFNSDSAYRFERSIDPMLQAIAIERATALILEYAGGKAGPLIDLIDPDYLPQVREVNLRENRLPQVLGCHIPDDTVENIFQRLGFGVKKSYDAFCWRVLVPPRRADIQIEEDLIEEIARMYGYTQIPSSMPLANLEVLPCPENRTSVFTVREALVNLGYQEVITYSFVDKRLQELFSPSELTREILNPISADMSVMRTSLFPGLIKTYLYNENRQQTRVRIFEIGQRFVESGSDLLQQTMLAGLVSGLALPEQWGDTSRLVDFYDLKGDLENLFQLGLDADKFQFKSGKQVGLHSGQTADLFYDDEFIGKMGALHPSISQELKIQQKVFLFELKLEKLELARLPSAKALSKFPEIRRDLAVLLDQAIPSQDIRYTIKSVAGELLQAINIFDVYQGKGITPGKKSVALALTLQHESRTLVDLEVTELMERVVDTLKERFNAELRG